MRCSAEGPYLVIHESGPSRALVLLNAEDGRSVRNTDPTKERQSLSSTALCASNLQGRPNNLRVPLNGGALLTDPRTLAAP